MSDLSAAKVASGRADEDGRLPRGAEMARSHASQRSRAATASRSPPQSQHLGAIKEAVAIVTTAEAACQDLSNRYRSFSASSSPACPSVLNVHQQVTSFHRGHMG